ncbi:TPA: Hok/Gef family protein [Salmonella enterica subsp. enterica serovar Mississippi]|nr:Hok/Gef family protein [Salmonella enterica]
MRLYAKELCACLVVVCFTILIYVWMVRGSRFALRAAHQKVAQSFRRIWPAKLNTVKSTGGE